MITELTIELIKIPSITPDDGGCIQLICDRLEPAGFKASHLRYGDVDNLWLVHGTGDPVLCFLGHTDVVPPGPNNEWDSDPFLPEIRDGLLYGRGAADMKGSLAAMVIALERYVTANPNHSGSLGLLLTSDEEGQAINGTTRVMDYLNKEGTQIKWCVVGEPSSQSTIGDIIKIGRRGSVTGRITVSGIQGHVAYPQRAENPIHLVIPALHELCDMVWDNGNEHYDPTSFQISNINAGTGADNVIPGKVDIQFNVRHSTECNEQQIKQKIHDVLVNHNLRFDLDWLPVSKPYLTNTSELISITKDVIHSVIGQSPELSTSGGTSDGRFVAPTGAEVIELGPVNKTIHKVNECVNVEDLVILEKMYNGIITNLINS